MSLTEHLTELRTRLLWILAIIFVSFFITYGFGEIIINYLLSPLKDSMGSEGKIIYIGLLDKVLTQFQLAFWSSIIFSSPLWFHQFWLFIRPALYDHELKKIRPFVFVGFGLFWLGIFFTYYVVFPFTFKTVLAFGIADIDAYLSLKDYIVLASKVLVFMGFLFQLPNILLLLISLKIVERKLLLTSRKYVITAFAILSAILTPPDVITMITLWIPMVLLYELGLQLTRLVDKEGDDKQQE